MITEVDVLAINLARRQAMISTGEIISIDVFLDAEGDETDDLSEANQFITEVTQEHGCFLGSVAFFTNSASKH